MFTAEQLKQAHSKVKSGSDFPAWVQDVKHLGVDHYNTYVSDGRTDFSGKTGQASWPAKYDVLQIADISSKEKLNTALKTHQQGLSDYPTFCKEAAEAGVEKWTVDTEALTCTYFDKSGNEMLMEKVPE